MAPGQRSALSATVLVGGLVLVAGSGQAQGARQDQLLPRWQEMAQGSDFGENG